MVRGGDRGETQLSGSLGNTLTGGPRNAGATRVPSSPARVPPPGPAWNVTQPCPPQAQGPRTPRGQAGPTAAQSYPLPLHRPAQVTALWRKLERLAP